MADIHFESCKADPDLFMISGTRSDSTLHWHLVVLYIAKILSIMVDPERFLYKELATMFTLKDKSNGPPMQHIGNKVSQVNIESGKKRWGPSDPLSILKFNQ